MRCSLNSCFTILWESYAPADSECFLQVRTVKDCCSVLSMVPTPTDPEPASQTPMRKVVIGLSVWISGDISAYLSSGDPRCHSVSADSRREPRTRVLATGPQDTPHFRVQLERARGLEVARTAEKLQKSATPWRFWSTTCPETRSARLNPF